MERIVSFDEFKRKAIEIAEDDSMDGGQEKQHYMFFQNLASIKHHIEEIMKMNPDEVDDLLKNGHDWAADHIATSKDDIQEVAEWIRNEMEGGEESAEEIIEPENVEVEVEVEDDEKPEIEDGENEEGEEGEEDRNED
jgi:hypothetical protein